MLRVWIGSTIVRLKTDAFYRNALLFMIASLITSGLNYLYYPIMGRLIGVSGYGELQIVTSFLLQLSTVFVSLNLINVTIVANHTEKEGTALMTALQKVIFWLVVGLSVLVIVSSGMLQGFFQFSSPWPFILTVPSLIISAVSVFWTGYLQGHRDFFSLSVYTVLTALAKIVFSIGLVWVGMSVMGGILGIGLGLGFSLIFVRITANRPLPPLKETMLWPRRHELALIRKHLLYVIEVIVALIIMSVLLSIDSLLVKHFFSPEFAGQYAGVSTIARILFFASAPLVSVMLPAIRLQNPRESFRAFRKTILLSALVCASGLIVFSLAPSMLLHLFLGAAFAGTAAWLPPLALIAILVTLTNIIINYLLALRSHLAIIVSGLSLIAATILLSINHDSIMAIVTSTCIGLGVGQVVFWAVFIGKRGKLGQTTI